MYAFLNAAIQWFLIDLLHGMYTKYLAENKYAT